MNIDKRKHLLKRIEKVMLDENNQLDINIAFGYDEKSNKESSWIERNPNNTQTITITVNGGRLVKRNW